MPVTDLDQQRAVQLVSDDLHATVGGGFDDLVVANAVRVREFEDDPLVYLERVVNDTQQDMHDQFINTVWPKCPNHNHPLWFRDGHWWCEMDGVAVARLGSLRTC